MRLKVGRKKPVDVKIDDKQDYVGEGGEKIVFEKGGTAYCVYHDPKHAIAEKKFDELSAITHPQIITPKAMLFNERGERVGETMPFVDDVWMLPQLFPNKFRNREPGFTMDAEISLTEQMIDMMLHCHDKGITMVDPNETNWLVSKDFSKVFAIDTSCFQTPSFPATAIKLAIADPMASKFDAKSDYFSLAVVLGWLWVGIHPYAMYHPRFGRGPDETLQKMKKRISFFDGDAELNRACRPLERMPHRLHKWLLAVLSKGDRSMPPTSIGSGVNVVAFQVRTVTGDHVTMKQLETFDKPILDLCSGIPSHEKGVIRFNYPISNRTVEYRLADGRLESSGVDTPVQMNASQLFRSGDRAYAITGTAVSELAPKFVGSKMLVTSTKVGVVSNNPRAVKSYTGCVFQSLLGECLVSLFPERGKCYQASLPELKGYKLMHAKAIGQVLVVIAESKNEIYRMVFRFNEKFEKYDVRSVQCDSFAEANFAVTSRGVIVLIDENGRIELSRAVINVNDIKYIEDPQIDASCTVFEHRHKTVVARDNTLFEITMK